MSEPPQQFSPNLSHAAWENAFTPAELDRIEAFGDALTLGKAILVGDMEGASYDHVRITRTAWIDPGPDTKWIYDRMQMVLRIMNDRIWQFDIRGFSESFQYTVYHGAEGGHYDWHVDQGDMTNARKLSASLQLTDPSAYDDCDLQVHGVNKVETAPRERGTLIVFPSYVLHRVTPITRGTRKSVVVWTTGPNFR